MTCDGDCHGDGGCRSDDDMSNEELIALIRMECMLKINAAIVAYEANRAMQMVFGLPIDVEWWKMGHDAHMAYLEGVRLILEDEDPTPVTLQERVMYAIVNTMVP